MHEAFMSVSFNKGKVSFVRVCSFISIKLQDYKY